MNAVTATQENPTSTIAATRPPLAVRAAQLVLVGPLGALVLFGAVYFSAIAPSQELTAGDWVVTAWALVLGAASLGLGACLSRGVPALRRAAMALVGVHLVFGLLKIVAYDEPEAAGFMVFDALVLALLAGRPARRFFGQRIGR